MPHLYVATEETIAAERDLLLPYVHNPAKYWQHIADSLIGAALLVEMEHQRECQRDVCRTCMNVARLLVPVHAHVAVQPSGCVCDDCIVYPSTPPRTTRARKAKRR